MNAQLATGPIPRPLLRESVLERIRDAILDGTLPPGERLRDDDLEEWLEVSRTPIRGALHELGRIGLVEMKPNRYTRVTVPTEQDRSHAGQTLAVLLGGSACLIVPHLGLAARETLAEKADCIAHAIENDELSTIEISALWRSYAQGSPNGCLTHLFEQNIDALVFKAHLQTSFPCASADQQADAWQDLADGLRRGSSSETRETIVRIYGLR
ncbi:MULTISPECIES: GntR family transcriptional regulator [unclassified Microbacterium]|uniref:GntR family transcriptional regulator n=1 Tax=unclassified Microbacterium TaxID=2609290 RepID=UPI0022EFDACB|nr:GntR family transcriptional regulator [Streptomyces sp. MS2A]